MTGAENRQQAVPKVAYLVNQYPKVSHTFIRREIFALERHGVPVQRIALRGWDDEMVDAADRLERDRTWYVLRAGVGALLWAMIRTLLATPWRFAAAFALAMRVGWRDIRPLRFHLAYLGEACRILPRLRSWGITRLHAHFSTNSTEVAMLTRVLGGPPYSFTVHGTDDFDIMAFEGFREKVGRATFVAASSFYARSQIYRWTDHAQWVKVKIVHCGLERAFYEVESAPSPAGGHRLVCIGRLCKEKGQMLLVEAAHRLHQKGYEFELVLGGDGEMRPDLERLIADRGLHGRVRITGWISGDQVRGQILAARALILPSFAEGLPVVIMEAMALQRPVLATYVAGIPELVQPEKNGWLVPAGDLDELTAAMEACLSCSVEELKSMGKAARERVLERHSVDVEAAKLAALFGIS